MKQEESRQAQMNNYRAFGRRPGNRNMTVEKPQNGKKTLKRLMGYFVSEKKMLFLLMLAVVVVVACSVYAPKLQSNAIDAIAGRQWDKLSPILIVMVIIYIIHSICTYMQSKLSAVLSQNIVSRMRKDLFLNIVLILLVLSRLIIHSSCFQCFLILLYLLLILLDQLLYLLLLYPKAFYLIPRHI